jgi:hypothetical protein
VSTPKHATPGDVSFRASLLRNIVGGVLLVLLVAMVFGLLGMIGRADQPLAAADPQDESDAEDAEVVGDPDPEPAPESEPDDTEPASDPEPEPPEPAPEPGTEPEPDQGSGDAIDPATVSVQVLDGYRSDGGAAAGLVADQLAEAGYRIVARNPAIAYSVTTVLFTAGNEPAARQIAREIGATEVRQQTNLSAQVDVHVVVGSDRG